MTQFPSPREVITVKPTDSALVDLLSKEFNVSPLIATILAARKLTTADECQRFFHPDIDKFLDPFLFEDMDRSVERIRRAIGDREKITVFWDYDVDGVTATALLVKVLKKCGAECDYYLPNRLTEGYGISADGIDEIAKRKTGLIISVDCGITAHKEISRAGGYGIDVIVTDHHEPHAKLPDAYAILNPKTSGYPDKNLAGVGVALKLCQAMTKAFQADRYFWLDHLDIVSLGTAADIVPLIGENRVIVKHGFEMLTWTVNPGLKELMSAQKLSGKSLTTRDVVFHIAPCINAAGRLGDPSRGVKLLLTDDPAEARLYANELWQENMERRALDNQVQEEAVKWVMENCDPQRDYAIVAADKGWHAGVIGITASRLVDKFYRPAFLFTINEDGFAKGSGRSVPGLNLIEALNETCDLLESYGGHEAAAGATIRSENIDAFRKNFNNAVKSRISMDRLVPSVTADAVTSLGNLTPKLFKMFKQMEPFGPGNMRPVLLCTGLKNRYEPKIVGNGHLKMTVTGDGLVMDAIAFNFGDRFEEIRKAEKYTLAFSLDQNEWNGKVNLQMKVKGVAV